MNLHSEIGIPFLKQVLSQFQSKIELHRQDRSVKTSFFSRMTRTHCSQQRGWRCAVKKMSLSQNKRFVCQIVNCLCLDDRETASAINSCPALAQKQTCFAHE